MKERTKVNGGAAPQSSGFLALLERDTGDLSARQDAILEAFDSGCWAIGLRLIEVGLLRHPRDPGLWALSGYAHLRMERYEDAELALATAIDCGMDAVEVRYSLAAALCMQRRYADALLHLGVEMTSTMPSSALLRARCLQALGRRDEAGRECAAPLSLM